MGIYKETLNSNKFFLAVLVSGRAQLYYLMVKYQSNKSFCYQASNTFITSLLTEKKNNVLIGEFFGDQQAFCSFKSLKIGQVQTRSRQLPDNYCRQISNVGRKKKKEKR